LDYRPNGNLKNNVWFAEIQQDKTIGKWKESEFALPLAVSGHQCFIVNNYIYLAGWDKQKSVTAIWYSEILNDHSIGEWKESEHFLPKGFGQHQCFTSNGYIYCTGGCIDINTIYSNIWYTKQTNNGETEEWKSTESLPTKIAGHQCISLNGYIYLIGGLSSGSSFLDKVWYTKSLEDGTLEEWKLTKKLPKASAFHRCFTTNGNIYCTGGDMGSGKFFDEIWYTQWGVDGLIEEWIPTTNFLPQKLRGHQIKSLDSFIYLCGGDPNTNGSYLSFLLPFLKTHVNKDLWYITDKLELNLASEYELGYYYLIDNSSSTTVSVTNSQYTNKNLLSLRSGIAIDHGTHYLHFALANKTYHPQQTYHFQFNNFISQIEIFSETHPNQNKWYTLNNCIVNIKNKPNGINVRYIIDDKQDTIPNSSSVLLITDSFVIPGNEPGSYFVHVRAEDSNGNLASENLTSHFRFNIIDQNQTLLQSFDLNVDKKIDIIDAIIAIKTVSFIDEATSVNLAKEKDEREVGIYETINILKVIAGF